MDVKRENVVLWLAFALPPFAWLTMFLANYALVPAVCASGSSVGLHLTTLAGLIAAVTGSGFAWRLWRHNGAMWPNGQSGGVARARFMSLGSLLLGAFTAVVILAQWMVIALVGPCDR